MHPLTTISNRLDRLTESVKLEVERNQQRSRDDEM